MASIQGYLCTQKRKNMHKAAVERTARFDCDSATAWSEEGVIWVGFTASGNKDHGIELGLPLNTAPVVASLIGAVVGGSKKATAEI